VNANDLALTPEVDRYSMSGALAHLLRGASCLEQIPAVLANTYMIFSVNAMSSIFRVLDTAPGHVSSVSGTPSAGCWSEAAAPLPECPRETLKI
jgi:ADP-heptose:LPS heptosyltransferase